MNAKVWNIRDQEFQQRQLTNNPALQHNVISLGNLVVNLFLIKGRKLNLVQSESRSCKRKNDS